MDVFGVLARGCCEADFLPNAGFQVEQQPRPLLAFVAFSTRRQRVNTRPSVGKASTFRLHGAWRRLLPFFFSTHPFPHPHTMELVGDVSQSTHTDTPASGERQVHPDPTLIDRWVLRMSEGVQSMGRR